MTQEQKIIRMKVGLLEFTKQLGNISQACKMMGYSRDSFYRLTNPSSKYIALWFYAAYRTVGGLKGDVHSGGTLLQAAPVGDQAGLERRFVAWRAWAFSPRA